MQVINTSDAYTDLLPLTSADVDADLCILVVTMLRVESAMNSSLVNSLAFLGPLLFWGVPCERD